MEAKFEELIEGFVTNNIGISEAFLGPSLATALQQNLLSLDNDSLMLRAGIGNAGIRDINNKIRGDKTCWLNTESKDNAEMEFLDIVAQFIGYLNQTCYTGLNACEFHYALYEEGSFYTRHRDSFKNDDSRKYSMINYLNNGWTENDGGQLIVHHKESVQEILPLNQKAIFFQSNVLEHEVAASRRPRMSITGWLKKV